VIDIRSFLGLARYYRRFIKNFSKIAKPMTNLLKKNNEFEWTPECEHSFQTLKHKLTTTPVLALPDIQKDFVVYWLRFDAEWESHCLCIPTVEGP
jgi:hypothetical protein